MAPDRGPTVTADPSQHPSTSTEDMAHDTSDDPEASGDEGSMAVEGTQTYDEAAAFLASRAGEGQNFTVRGVVVGLAIGVLICFSNMYFGLQTGWVSGMAMPAALIGFAFFKAVAKHINYPFTPVENVLVQTVAGAVGTMPLGCGFVGVLPALEYLLKPEDNGPLRLRTWKLIIWAVGLCFFGVFIAVPLRKEVIIREKLRFPSGTATALMIGVLHGNTEGVEKQENPMETFRRRSQDMLRPSRSVDRREGEAPDAQVEEADFRSDWKARIRLLIIAFAVSAVYVCLHATFRSITYISCPDTCILLHTPITQYTNPWCPLDAEVALDTESVSSICWSRHHYGSCNNDAYASWCPGRLGHTFSLSQKQRLGARPC